MVLIHNMPEISGSHPHFFYSFHWQDCLILPEPPLVFGRDKEGRNTHYLQPLRDSLQQNLGCPYLVLTSTSY